MFGMGFMEIFLVLVVAIVALGPEKLPTAVVDIAKFFKKLKGGIDDAKTTIDNELKISEMKKQADEFKASVGNVTSMARVDLESLNTDRLLDIDDEPKQIVKPKPKPKKSKKEKITLEDKEA